MKKVLIVDDEVNCIKIVQAFIETHRLPMEICGSAISGESALIMIKKMRPDIVFMDIEMPGYNGLEVIKMVKEALDYNVHFVIISAYDNFKYAQEAMRLGVSDFLLKPLDREEFFTMVHRIFGFKFTDNQGFNDILAYVHDNYSDELTLNDCAERFHISTNHITRLFKQYLTMGFTQYKNKIRIDHAKRLFNNTDYSIKEISQEVGFSNLNYFYRVFKEQMGVTPKVYQENK